MRGPSIAHIVLVIAMLAMVPLLTTSNAVLNFLIVALLIALVGQGWNVLGGYGGQYSFGHAAFFGMGAYSSALFAKFVMPDPVVGLLAGMAASFAYLPLFWAGQGAFSTLKVVLRAFHVYATHIAILCMASVFCFPGRLRRVLYLVSAAAMSPPTDSPATAMRLASKPLAAPSRIAHWAVA